MAKSFKLTNERAKYLLELAHRTQAKEGEWEAALNDLVDSLEDIVSVTEEPERVIFRKFPHNGEVIALLPDQYNPRNGNIGSYAHNGQHAETYPDYGDTVPADEHEYAPLLGELKRQGYANLRVTKRLTIRR